MSVSTAAGGRTGPVDALREMWSAADGLLFDFDGVIADSEPFFRRAWNTALRPWGHEISEEDYWLYWSSRGEGLEGEISRRSLSGIDREQAGAVMKKTYEGFCENGDIPLFPAAPGLLSELVASERAGGKPFCIASNTPSRLIRTILASGGAPVPRVVGGEGLRRKPAPDIFLAAAAVLGTEPGRTLVFEDSWKGAAAAAGGGFLCVAVRNSHNASLYIPAELTINGIKDVMDVLKSLSGSTDRRG